MRITKYFFLNLIVVVLDNYQEIQFFKLNRFLIKLNIFNTRHFETIRIKIL